MSKVCYFASDIPLKEKKNPYIKTYSVNQAIEAGIEIDLELLKNVDKDESDVIIWMESEEYAEFPSIYMTELYCEAPKSGKKYYAEISGIPEMDLKGIREYIFEHMQNKNGECMSNLELWYIWLGNDEEGISEKIISLDDLTEEYLREVFMDDEIDYKITIKR